MPKKVVGVTTAPHVYHVSKEGRKILQEQLAAYEQEYAELRAKLIELRQLKDAEEFDLVDDSLRLAFLEKKIGQFKYTIARCKVSDTPASDIVQLGSKVRLEHSGGHIECVLVSALEADPSKGRISDQSPLGRALVGKVVNAMVEVVAPRAKVLYRIVGIET